MKLRMRIAVFSLSLGMASYLFADPISDLNRVMGGPATGIGTKSSPATDAAPEATANESKNDTGDDTLYRGKTSESQNLMLRDEGPLHFKTRPKEKVQEVDSLKALQSSGSDPKFDGSLLNSGITSIDNVSKKISEDPDGASEGEPRFKTKRLTFTPRENDEPKKAETDATPSPSPSATPSVKAKDSKPKQ